MGEAFKVGMALLHRLGRYASSFHQEHHDDVREQEERLLQQGSHRLDRGHFLRAPENLPGYAYAEVGELPVLILRMGGQQDDPQTTPAPASLAKRTTFSSTFVTAQWPMSKSPGPIRGLVVS